jgi:hypothetical protein
VVGLKLDLMVVELVCLLEMVVELVCLLEMALSFELLIGLLYDQQRYQQNGLVLG